MSVALDNTVESQSAQMNLLLYQIYRPYLNGKNFFNDFLYFVFTNLKCQKVNILFCLETGKSASVHFSPLCTENAPVFIRETVNQLCFFPFGEN